MERRSQSHILDDITSTQKLATRNDVASDDIVSVQHLTIGDDFALYTEEDFTPDSETIISTMPKCCLSKDNDKLNTIY